MTRSRSAGTRALVVSMLIAAGLVLGRAGAEGSLEVTDAWIRLLPGDGPMAGYLVLHNRGTTPVTVTGASSPAFARVEAHETVRHDGEMSMRPAGPVTVPPGASVAFRPGGLHLMLMQRRTELRVGDQVRIELRLSDGTVVGAQFAVRPAWER